MSPKEKALMKNKRKEYMGNEKKEEEGKMKEGKGGKDNRKNIMKYTKFHESSPERDGVC